jgi:hypothetical protein
LHFALSTQHSTVGALPDYNHTLFPNRTLQPDMPRVASRL